METFQGFFSYAHADEEGDPELIEALTKKLERKVTNQLLNAKFEIWKDTEKLRTGDKWDERLEETVRKSDIFIVSYSPKWLQSEYCRKEFSIFHEVESTRPHGEFIAPFLIRRLGSQKKHLNNEQKETADLVENRQHFEMLATDFVKLSAKKQRVLVDKIADDIVGMIERLRIGPELEAAAYPVARNLRRRRDAEFSANARNFEEVDYVFCHGIEVQKGEDAAILASQFDFVDRLYVQAGETRVEFGIRRADLQLSNNGDGKILTSDHVHGCPNVRYLRPQNDPDALVISMDPSEGRATLGEMALPPGPATGENRLSEIAKLKGTDSKNLKAQLSVSLNVEGLKLKGVDDADLSNVVMDQIDAILAVAANKKLDETGKRSVRDIKIEEVEK